MPHFSLALATSLAAFLICILLIIALRPWLERYALARPNARSSHKVPTAQGGGVAVIAGTILSILLVQQIFQIGDVALTAVFAATAFIACVGAVDDLRPIPVLPRLFLQTAVVVALLAALPPDVHVFGFMPVWLERAILVVSGLWFINLVNFMDGIDWITVAEVVPITLTLTLLGMFQQLPLGATLVAMALCGAMIGFAPFNRPIAKLFLGDVGSLPIGLLLGWCLLQLAAAGHTIAALLLPLYYLADATITLIHRLLNAEVVWIAHRGHFYQRATVNGFTVTHVVSEIFALNLLLAGLATVSVFAKSKHIDLSCLIIGTSVVAFVLLRFSRSRN